MRVLLSTMGMLLFLFLFYRILTDGDLHVHDIVSYAPTALQSLQRNTPFCPEVLENDLTWKPTALVHWLVDNSYGWISRILWVPMTIAFSLSSLSLLRVLGELGYHRRGEGGRT